MREAFALRASGWPLSWLSVRYEKDRTAIRLHLNAHNIKPLSGVLGKDSKATDMEAEQKALDDSRYFINEWGERICRGKSYRDYIEDHKRRDPAYRFHVNPYAANPAAFADSVEPGDL